MKLQHPLAVVCDDNKALQFIYIADSYNHKVYVSKYHLPHYLFLLIRLNRLMLLVNTAPHWQVLAKLF